MPILTSRSISKNSLRGLVNRYLARSRSVRLEAEVVRRIHVLTRQLGQTSDRQLLDRAAELRGRLEAGGDSASDDVLVFGFALVNEAARRSIGITFYDVQLLAGLVLARGAIAEMQTGEGKTFVAALAAFIYGLSGRGVHVITANRYLARRDYELLSPVYSRLGLSAGLLMEDATPEQKRAAYACDITYGPGYEFGFDYLRDQLALSGPQDWPLGSTFRNLLRGDGNPRTTSVGRGLRVAIVDEVDSVLLDDAGSPLILSDAGSRASADPGLYVAAMHEIQRLTCDADYVIDDTCKTVKLTQRGIGRIQSRPQVVAGQACLRPWSVSVEQALHAQHLLTRGADYIVRDGKIQLVDQLTGRIFSQRSWSEGLHQAVEAKEGVAVTTLRQPLARISRQRFFRQYERLCGMTGTATGSEREFRDVYGLKVVAIPLRKPSQREILPDRYFSHPSAKWAAVVEDLQQLHRTGRPVLVGTRTIAASESLANQLNDCGLPYRLLNGTQDADEAAIIERAGQQGAITIATNMAGRGTDIKLEPESAQRGGLHVIGTERHESHRIDRQLAGRSARQGDSGSARFFLSADDELIAVHGPWLRRRMQRLADKTGEINHDLSADVRQLQRRVEQCSHNRRRQIAQFDKHLENVMTNFYGDSAS